MSDENTVERVDPTYGAPGAGRGGAARELAEGFAARRESSFERLRRSEPFCAYVRRTAGTGLPRTEENV